MTAPTPVEPTTRRITIEQVSRVEGHGKVTVLLDEQGHVSEARLHIVEFRGFERFIQGRPYWEVPVMVQRLCGICPVSHHLAASKAFDVVVGAKRLTPTAEKIRRLMHYGQMLQSHALHFFHLASPDLVFGFDSEVGRRNIIGIAAAYPELARQGVLLRKYGQEVIRMTAGKRVHGTGSVPGGVNKALSAAERAELQKGVPEVIRWAQAGVDLVKSLHAKNVALHESFGRCPSKLLSLVGPEGRLDFYDGHLRVRDERGAILFDGIEPKHYRAHIEEAIKPWSYMKFPYLKAVGQAEGWYKVGPLARVQNCDFIHTPLAEVERTNFRSAHHGEIAHAPLAYHWARLIEMLHAAEVIQELLSDDDIVADSLMAQGERTGEGVGIIEAPRGTLIHHYQVAPNDLVTMCNLIVSTTHNNQAMNESLKQVAHEYLDGHTITEGLLNHLEVAIRAYDPCLSCATHALGQMPLTLELRDAAGALIASQTKSIRA